MLFEIRLLPARFGDCIWIEYGQKSKTSRILIDGGTGGTRQEITDMILALPEEERIIELLVVTHIDRDHIEGILWFLEQDVLPCRIENIWFNGWPHLPQNPKVEMFGSVQGERLTAAILKHKIPWNKHFSGEAVQTPETGPLPIITLKGGMAITLLSPYEKHLRKLRPVWVAELKKAGLHPGYALQPLPAEGSRVQAFGVMEIPDVEKLIKERFREDDGEANGSSIAFIGTFEGVSALFTGDAFPTTISTSLGRLPNPMAFAIVKLSHHGSKKSTSMELIQQLDCTRFAISTNGSNYHHPDQVNIARIIKAKPTPEFIFNYRSEENEIWESEALQKKYSYSTIYTKGEGIVIPLL